MLVIYHRNGTSVLANVRKCLLYSIYFVRKVGIRTTNVTNYMAWKRAIELSVDVHGTSIYAAASIGRSGESLSFAPILRYVSYFRSFIRSLLKSWSMYI